MSFGPTVDGAIGGDGQHYSANQISGMGPESVLARGLSGTVRGTQIFRGVPGAPRRPSRIARVHNRGGFGSIGLPRSPQSPNRSTPRNLFVDLLDARENDGAVARGLVLRAPRFGSADGIAGGSQLADRVSAAVSRRIAAAGDAAAQETERSLADVLAALEAAALEDAGQMNVG